MKKIQIEISDSVADYIALRIEAGGYRDIEEYFSALLAQDCAEPMSDTLRSSIRDGIRSLNEGCGIRVTPEMWEQKKQAFIARSREKRSEVA